MNLNNEDLLNKNSLSVKETIFLENNNLLKKEDISFNSETETIKITFAAKIKKEYSLQEENMELYADYMSESYNEIMFFNSFEDLQECLLDDNYNENYIDKARKQIYENNKPLIHLDGRNFKNVILTENEYKKGIRIKHLPKLIEQKS
uniref:hypothetical protein n=1 Tax=Carnobacterium sp. TaxID=48221 RepID=UPI00344C4722